MKWTGFALGEARGTVQGGVGPLPCGLGGKRESCEELNEPFDPLDGRGQV